MSLLRFINKVLLKLTYSLAMTIVAITVMALCLSALTRFVSGTGYDWLIELPPVLVCWLVFPLLGPLLKEGSHIKVDFLSSNLSERQHYFIKIFVNVIILAASLVFLKAGIDATLLYFRLGQLMELELDIPIWWMYLSFPVGFAIMTLFSIELLLDVLIKNDVEKKDTY